MRIISDCPHRIAVHGRTGWHCQLAGQIAGAPAPVNDSACQHCCTMPLPTIEAPNNVVASMAVGAAVDEAHMRAILARVSPFLKKGVAQPVSRPKPCMHLGRVIDRTNGNCSRCWTRHCDHFRRGVRQDRDCETCQVYVADDDDGDVGEDGGETGDKATQASRGDEAGTEGDLLPSSPALPTPPRPPRKLILHCGLSPGDIVVMTAAVRELHHQYPGRFVTDVRTPCPEIWEGNPHVTPLADGDADAEAIRCQYPLIHESGRRPVHFLEGFCDDLARQLNLPTLRPTEFRGDIYLSPDERQWIGQVQEITGRPTRYWLVNAGTKPDYTTKGWPWEHYQRVVNDLRGRVQFVQVGAVEHNHQPLQGAIDLRGKTTLRQLIRLTHHADGVLTGVSLPMHLAAAVPRQAHVAGLRPCVVVAGGREPAHWEQYPGHQYLHTIGALSCCADNGCWRSRVVPLGDGDDKDRSLCDQPQAGHPRCMWLITPADVVRAIERYLHGGV